MLQLCIASLRTKTKQIMCKIDHTVRVEFAANKPGHTLCFGKYPVWQQAE